jgi:putative hydrolase of the HAD superfamily
MDGVLAQGTNSADEILRENNITMEEFFKNWTTSKAVSDFETGSITPEEFSEARGNELDMGLKQNAVMNILIARKSVLYDGAEQLLDNLYKRNFVLACLSNTNVLHWNNIEGKEVFERYFLMKFLSYEMGLIKPQKEIYLSVLNTLQCKAHEILYFDDSKKNIDTALNLRFNAVHVNDFYDLAEKIDKVLSVKVI